MKEPRDYTLRNIRLRAGLEQKELAIMLHLDLSNPSRRELLYLFDDLPIHYVRSWVQACGGKMTITIEMPSGEDIIR